MRLTLLWLGAVLAVAAGCGGRTDEEEGRGGDDQGSLPGSGDADAEPGAPVGEDESVLLPGCERGFKPGSEPDRACNWLAKGTCYEDKLEACACLCPRDPSATSHCASGFPVENGRVEVYCY